MKASCYLIENALESCDSVRLNLGTIHLELSTHGQQSMHMRLLAATTSQMPRTGR
jgi:hypothetical protein